MRQSKAIAGAGVVRTGAVSIRRGLVAIVVAAGLAWAAYGFAQEAYISHRLDRQLSDLRQQNALLAAQNQGYFRDIQALISGTADEEEARLNGYARSNERLYLVTSTPTPAPAPTPTAPRASPSSR